MARISAESYELPHTRELAAFNFRSETTINISTDHGEA